MNAYFADTFYFLALLNRSDPAHSKAIAYSRQPGIQFVTTDYILLELADGLNKRHARNEFIALNAALNGDPKFTIVEGTRELMQRGIELYSSRRDKEWGVTDCLSFVVMQDQGITEALTGDKHFEQAGYVALLK